MKKSKHLTAKLKKKLLKKREIANQLLVIFVVKNVTME